MAVKKKAIIMPAVIALVVGGGIYGVSQMAKSANEAMIANMKYSAVPAGMNDLSDTLSATGTVIGNGTVDVTTKLNCSVSEVKVSLGDMVKEGDLLCVFDSTELQEEYDSLKEQLDTSDKKEKSGHDKNARDLTSTENKKATALARAQRAIDNATKERDEAYDKYNKLVGEYNTAIDEGNELYDYDTAYAAIEQMKPTLKTLDEAVTQAQEAYNDTATQYDESIQSIQDLIDAEAYDVTDDGQKKLDKLSEQIEQCNVYAPQSGIITAMNVNEGSMPSAPSIMTIVNTDKTVIELTVKETDITKISEGMKATVTSKVLPGEEFPAKISRIVNVLTVDPASETSGYKVEVTLDETNDTLMIGMSATVDLVLNDVGEKLSIPYSGVFEEDGENYVFVAVPADDEQGGYIAEKRKVTTGTEADFYTELVSGDIKEGDLIIEDPTDGDLEPVEEGARVNINEKK
ncbi:efflux RND transporter periplasmic adaptor subunit [Ruminococcus sp.]|uniref:efflux RND transporter periplasmic adaptor subunit n=1 Tax=Ruminococcus sp. TaxID=41978 RepID=UPI0025FE1A28|nr:efflux RND transporter periplasmic adaptor subunit [Ruminococcus sp.]MBQ8965778.1 efflux RND transporter periplasmic adaptor subunit [Ruminococcus sp.]